MNRLSLALLAGVAAFTFISGAQAADLLVNSPAPSYGGGYSSPAGGWDGAYIGGFVGYGWGTAIDDLNNYSDIGLSGWLVGATLGANFTVTPGFVLGAAGDIAWSGVSGFETPADFDINWAGSLRGRAGFDGGAFMPYLTAGLAFAGATASETGTDSTQMHFGWTAGAGVEVAVVDNVSLDLQYRYTDYGTADYTLATDNATFDLTTHALTAGVNFKF
ncbi:MAG: porin family protein [Devosia sp.]|uniref:outer membrane protein n=1 Tax=Devosia sp. TaxID=1871048 RepID=UPI001AC4EDE5|nr:outer membrane protein [Devosia sp.]MBN9317165.1 porin family protein [Devosia sp.]